MSMPGSAAPGSSPTARCAISTRWRPDFIVLAGSIMPSHAHVHLVDFGGTVSVFGMVVSANDVIHCDRHGAVVVPA